MIEGVRRLPARPTVVLVVLTVLAVATALVLRDRRETGPPPRADEPALRQGVVPGAVARAVARAADLDQPPTVWSRIADCESGEWDADATPIPGSAEWDYGTGAADTHFQGGLHFAPQTWDAFRERSMPDNAGEATPVSQMLVAEDVLDEQGWRAWPVCSVKIGTR